MVGHSNAEMLWRVYVHAVEKELFAGAEIMESIMNKKIKKTRPQRPRHKKIANSQILPKNFWPKDKNSLQTLQGADFMLAGDAGVEPTLTVLETAVLPLN